MEVSPDTCGRRRVQHLLLIYFFVVKAAANCPKPEGGETSVLTNEALLMNDFPEGVKVTLECGNGYLLESGSGITTCTNGIWTEPDLTCKKVDCGPPKPQPNMKFDISAGTLFGSVLRVLCDKGYQLSGASYKTCYAKGWMGRAKCEIVTCDKPAGVNNGRSLWDSLDDPKYGEIIHYVCDKGYTLVGKDNVVCSETGQYDAQPPKCQEASTSTDSPATPTAAAPRAHRVKTSETPAVSPSEQVTEKSLNTRQDITEAPTLIPTTSSATATAPTAHRDKTIATSAAPTVSPSPPGGRGIFAAEKATTTSVTSATTFQDKQGGPVDTSKHNGYVAVVVSVVCVLLVVIVVVVVLHKFLLRRKGSYDTREDLKPELLQFQSL